MYRAIVAWQIRKSFLRMSAQEYDRAVDRMAPEVRQVFPGDHALGGERRSREAIRRWFQRVYRLLPDLGFEVKTVAVSGWPWSTEVAVEWVVRATATDGVPYVNHGSTFMRIRWGRVVDIREYLDTAVTAESLRRLAGSGVEEAAAAPIAG